ncbi:Rab-like_protein [Hexamita inflata]|uniref:Rab-like protein n=1 Tax=Hexamita inflata TaxID=28002 RepID=A0AA86UZS1_9EUKA|nr:Rab-like protein [Hexamita inflata]CAI9978850.1 Rab-like protein [Hexamita inflata]
MDKPISLVFVGDDFVGKTSFVYSILNKQLQQQYVLGVYEQIASKCTINNKVISYNLVDTPVYEDYDKIKDLSSFKDNSIFIMCYAVNNSSSLFGLVQWTQQIRSQGVLGPLVLLGMKDDLKYDASSIVTQKQLQFVKDKIGAQLDLVCSTENKYNTHFVIDQTLKLARKQYQQ